MTERRNAIRFDKAFPVYLSSDEGMTRGIARNISEGGIFIETREPYRLGTRVQVTFVSPDTRTEITLVGEVRYQCFLAYGGQGESESQLRGMGLRFLEEVEASVDLTGRLHPGEEPDALQDRMLH